MIAEPKSYPRVEADAAWSAATQRVEAYLRAHRLADASRIAELAADIVGLARSRPQPGVNPTTQAMETLDACMSAWFERLLPGAEVRDEQLLLRGRTALAMGNVPTRWPGNFLRGGALPMELVQAMRDPELRPGPEIQFRHMAPAEPVVAAAWANWPASLRSPYPRIVGVLLMAISAIGAAWAAPL